MTSVHGSLPATPVQLPATLMVEPAATSSIICWTMRALVPERMTAPDFTTQPTGSTCSSYAPASQKEPPPPGRGWPIWSVVYVTPATAHSP